MPNLEELVFNPQSQLILQSFAANQWKTEWGSIVTPPFITADSVVDEQTMLAIKFQALFEAVNHTQTRTGAAVLMRSLQSPPLLLEMIVAKQEALRELEARPELKGALNGLLGKVAETEEEEEFYNFLGGNYWLFRQYTVYKKARHFFISLAEEAQQIPKPHSQYLGLLVATLQNAKKTDAFDFFEGPVIKTFRGLKPENRMKFYSAFSYRLTYRALKPVTFLPTLGWLGAVIATLFIKPALSINIALLGVFPLVFYNMLGNTMPAQLDHKLFLNPLRELYLKDEGLQKAVDALGRLDEMLSFSKYAHATSGSMVLPAVTDASSHYLVVKNARNPVIAKSDPKFVPNDVSLNGQHLTLITGPNSGGKTTYCVTAAQLQLLGQIGCYLPADHAEMSIADRIAYSTPAFASLDTEGRFGTELARIRDIFFAATPKSLVVLDEIAEGTTFEEKLHHSGYILKGFVAKGNNTLVVTHNHQLVAVFVQRGMGIPLMTNFDSGKPTFRLAAGISTDSHAAAVAERIGFSERDVLKHLIEKGYLPQTQQSL